MPKTSINPRPTPQPKAADRNSQYSIDIGEKSVRIIKTNHAGVIMKAAEAEVDIPLTETPDAAYSLALTRAIKQARRNAKMPLGWGMPCVLVTGGPYVIIRRFTWPELPPAALLANARTEINPYLPDDMSAFTIHYRILRRNLKTETSSASLDILVAAIPASVSEAIVTGVHKAGFTPVRLDIRENARGKLTRIFFNQTEDADDNRLVPPSYAILDIGNSQINMAIYLNHVFYSNRYFSSNFNNTASLTEDNDIEPEILSENTDEVLFDTDSLANEVSSIIDYIHYRERGSRIEYILLIGDDEKTPGLYQSLTDNLDIPVCKNADWLPSGFFHKKLIIPDASPYFDALGASLPVAPKTAGTHHRLGADIDVKPPKKVNPAKQLLLPMACTLLVLAALLFVGIFFPSAALRILELTDQEIDKELAMHTVTAADLTELNNENALIQKEMNEIIEFYRAYPQASAVLNAVYEPRLDDEIFYQVIVANGVVSIAGDTADFNRLANHLVDFREHPLFAGSAANTADAYTGVLPDTDIDINGTNFTIKLALQYGAGDVK